MTKRWCLAGVLLPLLLVWTVAAEAQGENRIGIFTTPTAAADYIDLAPGVPFNVYFVLLSPRTAAGDTVAACNGFECRVTITGVAGTLFRLAETAHAGWNNAQVATDPFDARYAMFGLTPVPVVNDMVPLHAWTLMKMATSPYLLWLRPLEEPAVPGLLAFSYPGESGPVAVGARGTGDGFPSPVFTIDDGPDPLECRTFGEIKALYR